jgi:transcription elongation factor Elf1
METTEVVTCPYCGQPSLVLVDPSAGSLDTVEECSVCASQLDVHVRIEDYTVSALRVERVGW